MPPPMDEERNVEVEARIAAVRAAKAKRPVLSLDELDAILPPVPCLATRQREARNSANERR